MKLVHVIPIAKGISKDKLTYFTNQDIPPGSLIRVPLRNRTVPAILINSESVMGAKQSLKGSSYAMRKIEPKQSRTLFLPAFMEAVFVSADYFSSTPGAILSSVVPKLLFDEAESIPEPKIKKRAPKLETVSEKLIFAANEDVRYADYKSLVREEFARNSSLFIATPTIHDAERLAHVLEKGIEKYVYVLHSELTPKETLKRIQSCLESDHPALIIGTPSFLSIPKVGIGTIIIERESSRSYKQQKRPYVHMRNFAEIYAEKIGARIVFADQPLSVDSVYMARQREYEEWNSTRTRIQSNADQYIIDMRPQKDAVRKDFSPLSNELLHRIEELGDDARSFIFNVRKGIAPSTVCEDCGTLVRCDVCESPVVLHKGNKENVFICHHCGADRSAKERCKNCNGWKLKALGIGVDAVYDALVERFGEKRVFKIDRNTTTTFKQAMKVAEQFYKTKGAILVGTEFALSILYKKVTVSAIASLDSLLSIPDPKISEHIFSLITRVREFARSDFYIQTRQPDLPVITYATEGNVSSFYEKEILARKRFNYPPFSVLVKISAEGKPKDISRELENIEELLSKYDFTIYPNYTPIGGGNYVLHGLLKVPRNSWPEQELLNILKSLPPSIKINVNPVSTL